MSLLKIKFILKLVCSGEFPGRGLQTSHRTQGPCVNVSGYSKPYGLEGGEYIE